MPDQRSEFPDSSSEAATLVRLIAEPIGTDHFGVKAAIRRVARRLGWSFSRTKSVWYRDARRVSAEEIDQLRALARDTDEATGEGELERLRERIARLERILEQTVPEAAARNRIDLGRILLRQRG